MYFAAHCPSKLSASCGVIVASPIVEAPIITLVFRPVHGVSFMRCGLLLDGNGNGEFLLNTHP